MRHRRQYTVLATLALLAASTFGAAGATRAAGPPVNPAPPPTRVLIVLFDQMLSRPTPTKFDMPNFRRIRDAGTKFKNAYLGYMASETVIAHNVITSGQSPRHMGWVDEAYRDCANVFGKGVDAMHITGDLSLTDFGTLVDQRGVPQARRLPPHRLPGHQIHHGRREVLRRGIRHRRHGDIAVRLSSRRIQRHSDYPTGCRNLSVDGAGTNGRWREPVGKNVPIVHPTARCKGSTLCGRFFINSAGTTTTAPRPHSLRACIPEDGNRFFPGTDASAQAGHLGGDTWVADAAIEMMGTENWSGMFVTLGAIDKVGHMWGADADVARTSARPAPSRRTSSAQQRTPTSSWASS